MDLQIDKKYLLRLEHYTKFGRDGKYDPFAVRYVFALPKNAGLPDGYTVYIQARGVEWEHDENGRRPFDAKPLYTRELENGRTYRLDRSSDMVYVAIMTENREEGKKYKRYKYTADELYALYQNVDLAAAELAVAKIDIYIDGVAGNKHKMFYGNRIDETRYLVGKVQGCWFYCAELDTKRRIGSHGVTILGKINPSDEQEVQTLVRETERQIKEYERELTKIHSLRHEVERAAKWQFNYYLDKKNTFPADNNVPADENVINAIRAIHNSANEALQLIDSKLSEEAKVLDRIQSELKRKLKPFFQREAA